MKIYVLTCGNYSDYRVITATTDKSIAEKLSGRFDLAIEEFDSLTDASIADIKGQNHYTLHMYQNGKTEHGVFKNVPPDVFSVHPVYEIDNMNTSTYPPRPRMTISLWAKSPNHAIKAANEIRTQLIAMGRFNAGEEGEWK